MKQAIILAAGRGSRLGALINGAPKCMLKVGDKALIEHQYDALKKCGVERICVVVGYGANYVRKQLGDRVEYIENVRFAETNSLYSMSLTRNWIKGSFMMVNSDVLAHADIYDRVCNAAGTVLAYDSSSGNDAEEMKVAFHNNNLFGISKTMDQRLAHGESLGILKFSNDIVDLIFAEAESLLFEEGEKMWAPAAVNRIAPKQPIKGIDVAGLPWTEIDFPEDLNMARQEIWPNMSQVHCEVCVPANIIRK